MTKPKLVIKKYSDRRLYDAGSKRYVKLADIAKMVREGMDVEVRDARSGKDLTRVVLTQIIFEDARDRETALPIQFLRQLVVASDRKTHEFISWYLNNTMDLYHKAQQSLQSRITDAKSAVSGPLDFVRALLAGQQFPSERDTEEVDELRSRILELETRLAALTEVKPRPAKRKRSA